MDNQAVSQPGTIALEPPSTVLNPQTVNDVSGGGKPALTEPDTGDDSIESVLDAELKSLREADKTEKPDDKEAKTDDKEKVEAKDDKDADKAKDNPKTKLRSGSKELEGEELKAAKEQLAKAEKESVEGKEGAPDEAATGQEGSERRPSEGRQHVEPPARFLPKEREAWANVPNVVKSAIDRFTKEHETEVSQYRESHEEWTKLDKFQQMAKQHNSTVSDALERYTNLDGLLTSNPIEGIREILKTRGITPEQYANHVLSNPDAHRAPAPQAQPDPAVSQMSSELQTVKAQLEEMRNAQATATIIDPFRAANPRYDELENDIVFFLQSPKIPASLTPQEKLEAAYDMAVRINPTSAVEASQAREAPAATTARPAKLDAGTKSIRGAPDDGSDTAVEEADDDLNDMLRKQLRRLSA